MHDHSRLRRTAALTLSTAILVGSIPAYAADDGVKPTYDEAYYATTDYYGNLTQGSVVKSYTTNGAATLTDYGSYDELVNLTNGLTPSTADGKTVFTFDENDTPSHFYFEGKTSRPFEELPWTLSVQYALNGVAAKAEDLAGKTGVVEIHVDAIPNENASEYARNNYTLEAMAIFNQDDILSLEAPGAQVQLVGNLRAVLFIGLPGEECHFTIRVGSEDFSFGGMTFLMVPATLSQLEEIAKLAQRKDDLEDNYNKLSDSFDVLLDSMSGISSSLYATANGLDRLNEARDTISSGKAELYEKADLARGGLDALRDALSTLPDHMDSAAQLADDTHESLGKVNRALRDVQEQLAAVQDEVDDLYDNLDDIRRAGDATASDLKKLGQHVDSLKKGMDGLLDKLAALNIQVGGGDITMQGMTAAELSAKLKDAETLETLYLAAKGGQLTQEQFLAKMMILSGMAESDESAMAAISAMNEKIAAAVQQAMESGQFESPEDALAYVISGLSGSDKTAYELAQSVNALYDGIRGGAVSEETFFVKAQQMQAPSMSTAAAQANWTLFQQTKSLTSNAVELCDLLGTKGLSGHTVRLLTETGNVIARLDDSADEISGLLDCFDNALDAVDDLYDIMDENLPELKQTLTDSKATITALSSTISDTNDFLNSFETLLKSAGTQLDNGSKQTLQGLAAALRATARSLNTTGDVKSAKNNISSIIEDTWNEYTGDVNNLLLIDASAEAVSLTDERNDAPQSIQVLIRTQEIKEDDSVKEELAAKETAQTSFWDRVAQMFRDLWAAVTGIFTGKD